jgi:hypothetical protein
MAWVRHGRPWRAARHRGGEETVNVTVPVNTDAPHCQRHCGRVGRRRVLLRRR